MKKCIIFPAAVLFLLCNVIIPLSAQVQQELLPTDKLALITFKVTDYGEVAEEGAAIAVTGVDTNISVKGIADIDGTFKTLLPKGKKYKMSVRKFNEDFDFEKPLTIPSTEGFIRYEQKLKIRIVTEYVRTYTLDNVYFDTNKWNVKHESIPSLKTLLEALKSNAKMKVEIAGHTDNVGNDKSNMELSQRRADAVMKHLTENGISNDRILAKGYGETVPLANNETEEGRKQNRRTEVRVIAE